MHSQTKKTIGEYHPSGNTLQDYRPLVKGNDGKFYPKNSNNNYVGRFADGFRGCIGYGFVDALFRAYPDKANKDMKQINFKIFGLVYSQTNIPAPTLTFASHAVTSTSNTNAHQPPAKIPRVCAIFACINNLSQSSQKTIPISINNSLPSICLHLGLIESEENKMRILLNTGVVVKSRNLSYHLWVMSECSEMVGEFI